MDHQLVRNAANQTVKYVIRNGSKDPKAIQAAGEFLKEGIKNPSVAKMLEREELAYALVSDMERNINKSGDINFTEVAKSTFKALFGLIGAQSSKENKALYKELKNTFKEFYPKSQKLRNKILSKISTKTLDQIKDELDQIKNAL